MDDALWEAIVNCESTFDGQYFYGVITTHIFCRPSCRSRTPLRENVCIFHNLHEARIAGFRPCKRCRPDEKAIDPNEELVLAVKEMIEGHYKNPLTLDALARKLSISPFHLHRVFSRLTGTTPADYVLDVRTRAAEEALRTELFRTVTDIAMAIGFRSASHFQRCSRGKQGIARVTIESCMRISSCQGTWMTNQEFSVCSCFRLKGNTVIVCIRMLNISTAPVW